MLLNEITQPNEMKKLEQKLRPWRDWLVQGSHTPQQIVDELQRIIGDLVDVSLERSPNVDKGDMNASAFYDQEADREGDTAFGLELFFSTKDDQAMTITNPDPLINRVVDMMKHELLHQRQAQARDYEDHSAGKDKRDSNYEYMSRGDEIEAYAMNIADELVKKTSKKDAINLLRMANKTAQFKDEMGNFLSPELFGYMAMWNFDSKHPVIKRLLKKIYQYITAR